VTITTNVAEVVGMLNGYVARMRDMRGTMERIGTYAGNKALLAIMDEKDDPEGQPWTEWRDTTREHRIRKGTEKTGLLWDDGTLLASIKVQAGLRQVTVGTDVPYAKFLQEGTSKMAARPLLGWSDEDVEYAERLIALHVTGGI
jgi:phage gpG-like protein